MHAPPLRGAPLALLLGGIGVALYVGVGFTRASGSPLWLVAVLVVVALNLAVVRHGRAHAFRAYHPSPTGRVLALTVGAPRPLPASWVGGMNVAGALGRMNASLPMAVLEVAPALVTVRVRPGLLGRVFGIEPVTVCPADVAQVFPVRGRAGTAGVGLLQHDQPVAYFWTRQGPQVLEAIARAGFPVDWREQRPHPAGR